MSFLAAAAALFAVLVAACGGGNESGGALTVTVTERTTVTGSSGTTGSSQAEGTTSTSNAQEATNLVVTDEIRHSLWLAFVGDATTPEAKQTEGPLPGSVYYGEYQGIRYATAVFDVPGVGTTDQPTLLVQLPGTTWVSVSEIGNQPAEGVTAIPCPLRKIWDFGCAEED
jgi:hypothetical protein